MRAIVINRTVSLDHDDSPLEQANQALVALKRGPVRGAKVLEIQAEASFGPETNDA